MRLTPRVLLGASAATLALGNVGRIPGGVFGGRNAPIALNDLLLVPLWLFLLVFVVRGQRRWVLDSTAMWSMGFIVAAGFSSMLAIPRYGMGVSDALGMVAFLVRWVLYFGWFPLMVALVDARDVPGVWRRFDVAILCMAAFGLIQTAFLPGFAQMIHTGGTGMPTWDPQGRRLVSTLLDPNFAGIVIVIGLLMRLARVAEGIQDRAWPLAVLAVAVLLTVSRSSLLALAAGLAVIVAARGISMRLVRLFLVGALCGVPFITFFLAFASGFNKLRVDASALQRLIPWIRALELMRDYPALGVGFNAIAWAQRERGWHSIGGADVSLDGGLLFVGAMTGLVGLLLYSAILASVLRRARTLWNDAFVAPEQRAFATGTAAVTLSVVVHSFFVNSLLLPFVMQLLWVLWGGVSVLQRSSRRAVAMRRAVAVPAAIIAAVALSSCSPCSGLAECRTDPRVDLTGTIVAARTGLAVPGVQVTATLAQGVTATSLTDRDGRWRIVIDNPPRDLAGASIRVVAPGGTGYTVHDVAIAARTRAGDAQDVGRWMSHATARFQATLVFRGKPLPSATVTFTPNMGVSARDIGGPGTSNGAGIFSLEIEGGDLGSLIGTLNVTQPDVRSSSIRGFAIPLDYMYRLPQSKGTVTVGGQVAYGVLSRFRGTDQALPGIPVEFQRTGGIPTYSQVARTVTGDNGFFVIEFEPLVQDIEPINGRYVVGDLVFRMPGQSETRYRNVQLPVYDSTSLRLLGLFRYGESFNWAVELYDRGMLTQAAGVDVEFRQTGGVVISPSSLKGKTGADGRFQLRAAVSDTGVVRGDYIVTLPGQAPRVVRSLQLHTNNDDVLHFAGTVAIGERWAWALELWRHDILAPAPNVNVEFRQTAGPAITPATISTRTDASGRVELRAAVRDTGTVHGDLIVSPVGEAVRTIRNIQLRTFAGDELRFAGIYGFGAALRYVGEVLLPDGTPVVGATVEWTQTSGISATPASLRSSTDASGRFPLTLIPSQDGVAVGSIRITPRAPWIAGSVFRFADLALQTFEDGNLHLAVTYRIPPP